MKSSDYFSKAQTELEKRISEAEQKRLQEQAELKAAFETMLDWMYDSSTLAFTRIPDSTLKSFKPDRIQFAFNHTNSGDYIDVLMIRYTEGEDQFGDSNYTYRKLKLPFTCSFSSVPKIYRDRWHKPVATLCYGYFETSTFKPTWLRAPGYFDTVRSFKVGKYKAIYSDESEGSSYFEKMIRKL